MTTTAPPFTLWRWSFDDGKWVLICTDTKEVCEGATAGSYDEIRPAHAGPPPEGPHMHMTYADGCKRCAKQRALDNAELKREHDDHIKSLVLTLAHNLKFAGNTANLMLTAAETLTSDQVYDIELAEGTEGADLIHELQAMGRHLRNASRIVQARKTLFVDLDKAYADAQQITAGA